MNMSPREDVSSRSIPAAMHLCVNFCYCSLRFCVIFESTKTVKRCYYEKNTCSIADVGYPVRYGVLRSAATATA